MKAWLVLSVAEQPFWRVLTSPTDALLLAYWWHRPRLECKLLPEQPLRGNTRYKNLTSHRALCKDIYLSINTLLAFHLGRLNAVGHHKSFSCIFGRRAWSTYIKVWSRERNPWVESMFCINHTQVSTSAHTQRKQQKDKRIITALRGKESETARKIANQILECELRDLATPLPLAQKCSTYFQRKSSHPHIHIRRYSITKVLNTDEVVSLWCDVCTKKCIPGRSLVWFPVVQIKWQNISFEIASRTTCINISDLMPLSVESFQSVHCHLHSNKFPSLMNFLPLLFHSECCFSINIDKWKNKNKNTRIGCMIGRTLCTIRKYTISIQIYRIKY